MQWGEVGTSEIYYLQTNMEGSTLFHASNDYVPIKSFINIQLLTPT